MIKTTSKHKIKITAIIAGVLVILAVIVGFNLWLFEDKILILKTENFYRSNRDEFNQISTYFKGLYYNGLYEAGFSFSSPDEIKLKYDDGENYYENSYPLSDGKIASTLDSLRDKYRQDSDCGGFWYAAAFYDEDGDMLLIIRTYSDYLKSAKDRTWNLYLVYYDEGYTGYRSFLEIDKREDIKIEPFSGRWCTWTEKGWIG